MILLRMVKPWLRAFVRSLFRLRQEWRWARDEIEIARPATVSRHAQIGRRVRVTTPGAHIDPCVIGPYSILTNVMIRSFNHHTEYLNMQETAQAKVIGGKSMIAANPDPVKIGAGCWIGDNVCILSGVEIGDGVVIGAGSVVTKSIPAYAIAVGNPARVIRYRYPEEIVELIAPIDWWNWSDEKLRANVDLFEIDLTSVEPAVLRERLAQIK